MTTMHTDRPGTTPNLTRLERIEIEIQALRDEIREVASAVHETARLLAHLCQETEYLRSAVLKEPRPSVGEAGGTHS